MSRYNGNTPRRAGHGRRSYSHRCPCGHTMCASEQRQVRHAGGDPNHCLQCNGMLVQVGG